MGRYDELNGFIVEHIGGASNVDAVTHCMTRLRFTLKDDALADLEALGARADIMGAQFSNNQLQVIVGTTVDDIYAELLPTLGMGQAAASGADTSAAAPRGTVINRMIATITKIITPILGVLMGCSLVLGLQSALVALGLLTPGDGAYVLMNAIGNAIFTFFPILLGYTSAKAFGSDGYIGMIVGAALVFPGITDSLNQGDALVTVLAGTPFETAIHSTFFGIPIVFPANGYTSTVIPIMLAMYFISKFELFLKRTLPHATQFTFVPFLTIFVGVVATVLVIGPITNLASDAITLALEWVYALSPLVAGAVVGFLYTPLVVLGLHWPLVAIGINNLSTLGSDFVMPMIYTIPLAQMAAVFAVWLRSRGDVKTRQICVTAMISDFFCIIEPSIYGVTLPAKRRFVFTCIGSMVGGAIIGAFKVGNFASTIGVLGIVGFINPQTGDISNMLIVIVASLATMAVSFALTMVAERASAAQAA